MDIHEIIKNRRATPPKFMLKEEIPKETIRQLLENANWAPNHKKTEPWRFKIYTGESKQKIAEDIYDFLDKKSKEWPEINLQKVQSLKENIMKAPVVMTIILQRDETNRVPEWEEIAAVAMSVQNMWLTATEMGLGAFWATPPFLPFLHELVGIETGQKLLGFFFVGNIPMEYPSPGRSSIDLKAEWK